MSLFSTAVIDFYINTADAKSQLSGLQGAFSKTADKIQNNFITKLGGLALGGAGIKALTGIYDEASKIQNLAESWNLPIEKVSQFANSFTMLGGTTDDALGSIEKLQNLSNQLKFDSSGSLRELSARLGTNLFNKDFKGAIDSIRGSFSGLSSGAQKKVLDMLGTDNLPMLRMLKMSKSEYDKLNADAKEYGTLTGKTGLAIRNIELALARVKTSIKGVFNENLNKLSPILDKIAEKLDWIANLSPETKSGIVSITSALLVLAPALKLIGTLSSSVFSPMTLAIAGVAAGAFLLYQNWDKVTEAVKRYIEESPKLQEFLETLKSIFDALLNGVKTLFGWLKDNAEVFLDFFKGFTEGIEKAFGWIMSAGEWVGDKVAKGVQMLSPDYTAPMADNKASSVSNTSNRYFNQSFTIGTVKTEDAQSFVTYGQSRLPNGSVSQNMIGGTR